ncbi:hypothetical protein [Arthrobacter sp. B0490]|uniref:hypothetical protein n=1 Tax=Arthrobacter sp. B0490 TaxID=2058891 RepID=UPI0011B0512F|nr:hypothetical protein [Arthrobacter sp. B0490]
MTAQPVDTTPLIEPAQQATQETAREGTRAAVWHVLDEPAAVRFLPSGTPLALRWRGSIWQVIGEPLAWSSSDTLPERDTTPPSTDNTHSSRGSLGGLGSVDGRSIRGSLGSVVTTRFWRFRAQTGPASPVLEFDMNADARWEDWRLRRVTTIDGY